VKKQRQADRKSCDGQEPSPEQQGVRPEGWDCAEREHSQDGNDQAEASHQSSHFSITSVKARAVIAHY